MLLSIPSILSAVDSNFCLTISRFGFEQGNQKSTACVGGTRKLPKQMDPKDIEIELQRDSYTIFVQNGESASGSHHHLKTVLATMTFTIF